jgi:hypothetical protein
MIDWIHRTMRVVASVVVAGALSLPAGASAQSWPAVFDPLTLRTFNLTIDPADWETIRFDVSNEIEVPAQFWADDESPLVVSVRRKSSRALPSEANPIKIGLKIDINELVSGQLWHGLAKLSLENAGDIPALYEGMAWQLHQRTAAAGFYGPEAYPALANWVRVNINGEYAGVYTSVEQRDTQFLRNRGVRVAGQSWLYEIDDIDQWVLESGDPHSPTFRALCYQPFAPAPKGKNKPAVCRTPNDATLEATLDALIETDAMLAQGAVDAFADNPDALFSHGKNFFFADFDHSGLKRRYYPWDLDAVFRNTAGGIYGQGRNGLTQTPYQNILLNHAGFRARFNAILLALVADGAPLSGPGLHAFLDALEPVLGPALAEDPYVMEDPAGIFQSLRNWVSQRIPHVQGQILANGPPPPR